MQSFKSAASVALRMRLSAYTTCEVSDALIKLRVSHGGHIPDIHMLSPSSGSTRLCGRAYTVRMVLKSEADHPGARLEGHFIDAVPDECVIVIDAPLGA
jgi:regulator of RNase E activity RraA